MTSSEELSPSKVRKKLKLRRDRPLVGAWTHKSLDQNGQSTSQDLLRNGCSPSKKRKSTASPRTGSDSGSGRKQPAGKFKRSPLVETVPHSPPDSDDDCVVISDSDVDDNSAVVRRPHVKVSIKQSPCSASVGSWQQHSGSRSSAGYSDCGNDDDTVERTVVGTYGTRRCIGASPMLPTDDLPDLASDSVESHRQLGAMNTESSSGDFVVSEQSTSLRKRYLKTKVLSTKSSSVKCMTTQLGKNTAPSCKRCIIPPVPSTTSSSVDTSNDVLSSSETAVAGRCFTPGTLHKQNTRTDAYTIELSSSDEFTTPMYDQKNKRSCKRRLKPGPSNADSSSDEFVTSNRHVKYSYSHSKPRSSRCESRFPLSLTKGSRTLSLSCRQHVRHKQSLDPVVSTEDERKPEDVDIDGSTDSDEPLTSVVSQKIARRQMHDVVAQTGGDSDSDDASLSVLAVEEDDVHTKRKENDDWEQGDSVLASDPDTSQPLSVGDCLPSSPTMPQLSREMEDDKVLCQGIDDTEPPEVLARSDEITSYGNSSVCSDVGPCDDHNTCDSLPLIGSLSPIAVDQVVENRTTGTPSLGKRKMELRLTDFRVCKCEKCSSIQGRLRTLLMDITKTDVFDLVKTRSRTPTNYHSADDTETAMVRGRCQNRNFFDDIGASLFHCEESSMDFVLSTAESENNVQRTSGSKATTGHVVISDLQRQVNDEIDTCEKHDPAALSEVRDVPPSAEEVRSRGHVSDDDTAMDDVSTSKNDVAVTNNDMEMTDVTESKCDHSNDNSDGDDTRGGTDISDDDANDREDDLNVSDPMFSQQDDAIVLLSDYDDNDDSVFTNLMPLSNIKSEPTSESEQDIEIPEELGGSPGVLGKELGETQVLGEVLIPVKSEPESYPEQERVPAVERSEVKTKPVEESDGSVELISEAAPSGVRTGIPEELTEDVTVRPGERPSEKDQDVTTRNVAREHQEELAPGGSNDHTRIRAAALSSILQSFEKRVKSRRQRQAIDTDTDPSQHDDSVTKPCQSRQTLDTDTQPCRHGDMSYRVTKPCQSHRVVDTVSEPSHSHDAVEPWPVGVTPDFSDNDTSTTDEPETTAISDDNTFLVLSKRHKASTYGTTPTKSKLSLTPKRRKIHRSPIRARCLSPLKANIFYPRRRNSKVLPTKLAPGRSSSLPKLNSLTWATNKKHRLASTKGRFSEQLSVQDVRKAQRQMKDREVLQKKTLARAKSASVPQRFTSRSEALLQDMARACIKPPAANTAKRTTPTAKEHVSQPSVESPTTNTGLKSGGVAEQAAPPCVTSSTVRPVAPPVAQRTNCTAQQSVLPSVSERRVGEVKMPAPQTASSQCLSVDADLLLPILHWNALWLIEQKVGDRDPPVEGKQTVWPLVDSYDSFDQYLELVKPLLLLETWKSVHRDWMEKRPGCERMMTFVDGNFFIKHKHIDLIYEGVMTRERERASPPLSKNDLVVLDLRLAGQRPDRKPVFALVLKVVKFSPHDRREPLPPQTVKDGKNKDSLVTRITVRLYYRDYRIDKSKMMKVTVFTSLSTAIHQFMGLMSLPRSGLCRDILRPVNDDVFRSALPDRTVDPSLQSQQRVAQSAVQCVLGPPSLPRICLIQGPPGTGKTTTIINMITCILSSTKVNSAAQKRKVLLCTPSNAAIDELTRRLIQKSRHRPLQLVRVGAPLSMATDVSAYSLDALAKRRIQEEAKASCSSSCPSSINRNIESYRSKISKLEETYQVFLVAGNEDQANETKEERDKLKKRLQKLEKSLASKTGHVQGFQASEQRARREVLLNADVVCCTLNSCGSDTMLPLIPTKATNANPNPRMPQFTCVIVDEAAQCVELDCLIPLQFRCSKMILVGDQKQLPPTVISKRAMENNYNQSLFDRFYNYFSVSGHGQSIPIHMLDLQFRMHPEICHFPSQHFYKGQLKTDPKIQPSMQKFVYQHYLLFDIAYGAEKQEVAGELCNEMEADFVTELCEYLVTHGAQPLQPRHIGIITPYRKQRELIRSRLRQRGQRDIDIGTVDGFQGREKDVIVLSCVRARNKAGTIGFLDDKRRMNVALTRAKYALYVIGRLSSLQINSDWRKLIEDAKQRHLVVKVNSASNSRQVIREYCKKPQPQPQPHRRTNSGK